jgi:hypothetical protein
MSTTAASLSPAELTDQVLQTLERAPQPLTFFQIQRGLPRPYQNRTDELRQCLQEQVSQGRIHEFPPYRSKAPRFWTRDPEQHARLVIVEVLNEQAATQRQLLLKVRKRLQGLPDERLRQLLSEMLLDGRVRKLPPRMGGRANLLSTQQPQPRDYLAPVFQTLAGTLREVFKRLESEGVGRESFVRQAEEMWRTMPWDQLTQEEAEDLSSPTAPPTETPESEPFAPSAGGSEARQAGPEAEPAPASEPPAAEMPPS